MLYYYRGVVLKGNRKETPDMVRKVTVTKLVNDKVLVEEEFKNVEDIQFSREYIYIVTKKYVFPRKKEQIENISFN